MKKVIAILIALLVIACAFAVAEEAACDHNFTVRTKSAATCTKAEITEEYCTKCGHVNATFETAPANGHNFTIKTKAATCTEPEISTEYCTVCGFENGSFETGAANGHNFRIKDVAATCTTPKYAEEYCTVCGYVNERFEEGSALGHNKDALVAGYPATCTEKGLTDGYNCSRCGEVQVAQTEIPALGHDHEKDYVVKPTTNRRGYTVYTCIRCDHSYRDNYTAKLVAEAVVVDAPAYPYGSIVTDLDDNAKPYTAEVDKEAKHVCIIATAENGAYPLRELHLSLGLIAELKEDGIEEICFTVGEAEIVVPFSAFETEMMETVKADFPATLTGYIVTLDPTAVTAEGVEGCLVRIDMTSDTEEADGIEMGITGVMTNVNLFLNDVMLVVDDSKVYTA